MERRFTADYGRLYSEAALALYQSTELFNLRVTARVPARAPSADARDGRSGEVSPRRFRDVYWPGHGLQPTSVFFEAVPPGEEVEGPAIVELRHTSVGVAPGQQLRAGNDGTLTLARTVRT